MNNNKKEEDLSNPCMTITTVKERSSSTENELMCNACLLRESNAPVEAIINKNSQSLMKRQLTETKEEIKVVMNRINNIYSSLVQNEIESFPGEESLPSFEYISDINQLEAILKDQIKKELYQNQVTVFIVGHTALCEQKLKLISQINEFFVMNSKLLIDEAWEEQIGTDFDLENGPLQVKDSLTTASILSNRLSEINQEMIQYFTLQVARTGMVESPKYKTKKKLEKLEKSLQHSKEEINGLQGTIKQMLLELEDKEIQIVKLAKLLEVKRQECQEFKIAASMNYHYLGNIQALEKEVKEKNGQIWELHRKICTVESANTELKLAQVLTPTKLDCLIKQNEKMILDLKKKLEDEVLDEEDALEIAESLHKSQIQDLTVNHREEMLDLGMNHEQSILELTESKGSHKDSSQKSTSTKKSKSVTKQKSKGDSKTGKSPKNKDVKETPDSSQVSGTGAKEKGESTAKTTKAQSKQGKTVKQVPVETTTVDQSNLETLEVYDLTDNEAWAGLPSEQIPERFVQYRWLTTKKLKELDEQLKLTTLRTQRKVESLKSQFKEHKVKWEEERDLLQQQVMQLKGLQVAAEKEADSVMTQLEDFISEQEKMETQEHQDTISVEDESSNSMTTDIQKLDSQSETKAEVPNPIPSPKKEKLSSSLAAASTSAPTMGGNFSFAASSPTYDSRSSRANSARILKTPERKLTSSISSVDFNRTTDQKKIIQPDLNLSPAEEIFHRIGDNLTQPETLPQIGGDFGGGDDPTIRPESRRSTKEDSIKVNNAESTSNKLGNEMYEIILKFKENLVKLIGYKDLKSANELFEDIESILTTDDSASAEPDPNSDIFKGIQQTLKDITQLIYEQFQATRAEQKTSLKNKELPIDGQTDSLKTSEYSGSTNKFALRELMELYNQLQCQVVEDGQKHEAEQRQYASTLMEMQDTISSLQQQLEFTRKCQKNFVKQNQPYEPPVMFTRLDLQRNARIMTRALASQHINDEKYEQILQQMANYISLPVLRFQQLVKRYQHHCRLKEVYEEMRQQSQLNVIKGGSYEKEKNRLQRIYNIHNLYSNRWYKQSTLISMERRSQANSLTKTLEDLELESGLFLIKPIYSNRLKPGSRDSILRRKKNRFQASSSQQKQQPTDSFDATKAVGGNSHNNPGLNASEFHQEMVQNLSNNSLSYYKNQAGHTSPPMWAISMSQSSFQGNQKVPTGSEGFMGSTLSKSATASGITYETLLTTPRILELDINRMLIGQNNVSIKLNPQPTDESQQPSLRSYLSVCRPIASPRNRMNHATTQPLSNITNTGYLEVKTPPVTRLCTPKPKNGEELPNKLQTEAVALPPISLHLMTSSAAIGQDVVSK